MRELAARGIPGIAMSGFASGDDIRLSREAEFAEHLAKPVSLDVLLDAISRVASPFSGHRLVLELIPVAQKGGGAIPTPHARRPLATTASASRMPRSPNLSVPTGTSPKAGPAVADMAGKARTRWLTRSNTP